MGMGKNDRLHDHCKRMGMNEHSQRNDGTMVGGD